ncbi:MFS transporter [Nonomuraea sp. 3-1Str]|uniref:MFS transporter n=1 Tax=Nonomuraea sp. 3-1Str TaxID=2929801 RepID=UPI0028570F4C|nr:MFS transporter [Nonomuraea sp. 3-1Str]MDR8409142.1 MFS transporter [Nonomuraea sp. 3-1Str]
MSERGATFGEVFAVREFRVLFGSFALMIAGDSVKMLALSVLVYARTGSPGLSAAAYMAGWLPYILGGIFLLSLADRLPARPLMVTGELVRVAVCLALAYGGLPVWAMLTLVLVTGLFSPVFGAARSAMLPEVLPGDGFVLARSLMGVTSAGAQIAGLALGGAFLAAAGPGGALGVTAALAAMGAAVLWVGLPRRPARNAASAAPARNAASADQAGDAASADQARGAASANQAGDGPGGGPAGGPGQGAPGGAVRVTLRVNGLLLRDRRVRGLLLASWLPPACLAGAEAMVVPYLGGQGRAGTVLAAAAVGMAAGEFAVGRFAAPGLRERLSLPLAVLLGLPWLGFLAGPEMGWASVLAAVATSGLAYQLGLQRRFLEAVPEEARGQAFGLLSAGLMTGQAAGAALGGVLGEAAGPGVAIAAAGAAGVVAALALARVLRPAAGGGPVRKVTGAAHPSREG